MGLPLPSPGCITENQPKFLAVVVMEKTLLLLNGYLLQLFYIDFALRGRPWTDRVIRLINDQSSKTSFTSQK